MILFNSARRVKVANFGRGIAPANRWASESEYARHVEETTYSASEWAQLRDEAEAAMLDRYCRQADAEAAEMAEMGIDPARMDEMAEEAAMLDRITGQWTPAAQAAVEVRMIQVRGKRYTAELIASQDDEVLAAIRLTGPAGQVYDVAKTIHGITCTCPDFIWKREGLTGEPCKHGRACNAYGLLNPPKPARKAKPVTLAQKARAARLAGRKVAMA